MINLPVIIDTDPGTDDAVALLVAKKLNVNIDTIVSVSGNVGSNHTHKNVVNLNSFLGLNAKVIKGADTPISGNGITAEEVHGENGIGGVMLPEVLDNSYHIDELYSTLKSLKMVDMIALGPLTNVANLIKNHPDCKEYINSLTVMGCGIKVSNCPHNAEFNIGCDPTAAQIVFSSGINITVVPLDVTHKVFLTKEELEDICGFEIDKTDSSVLGKMSEIMYYNYKTSVEKGDDGALIHDATAVLAYLYPEKFTGVVGEIIVDKYGATTYETKGTTKILLDTDTEFIKEKLKFCFMKGQ